MVRPIDIDSYYRYNNHNVVTLMSVILCLPNNERMRRANKTEELLRVIILKLSIYKVNHHNYQLIYRNLSYLINRHDR